jgi:hypothetical protein
MLMFHISELIMLPTCIPGIPPLSPGRDIGYLTVMFRGFPQAFQESSGMGGFAQIT